MTLKIIGAGLAGCEAAWQAANRGIKVKLYEMKPKEFSPAHTNKDLCELVCSNSLKGNGLDNACGLLKEEMRRLNSIVIKCADETQVPAGGALAVDRDKFAALVTKNIRNHPNIEIVEETVNDIDTDEYTVVATGPLTHNALTESIGKLTGAKSLFFFDAAAPVVTTESINQDKTYMAARYGKGTADYINCPMEKDEYYAFVDELLAAEKAELHAFEKREIFEGCMPIEVMASRGRDTLRYGTLKPVGLYGEDGKRPYAVLQLRKENEAGTCYNLVGFQTNLKFPEQKRVFSMIPALKNAEFLRYGVMHRNTYIQSPDVLNRDFSCKNNRRMFFAGQITGVEGYVESAASGLLAAIHIADEVLGRAPHVFDERTVCGALETHISTLTKDFQPMNANFGILAPLPVRIKDKKERYKTLAERALETIRAEIAKNDGNTNKEV